MVKIMGIIAQIDCSTFQQLVETMNSRIFNFSSKNSTFHLRISLWDMDRAVFIIHSVVVRKVVVSLNTLLQYKTQGFYRLRKVGL